MKASVAITQGIPESVTVVYINVLIALLTIPATMFAGEMFKFLLAPYIAYMVFSKRAEFFPALLIHFALGSTLSFVILFCCLGLTVFYCRTWIKIGLGWLLAMVVAPLPSLVWQSIGRAVHGQAGVVETLNPLTMYLGLFAFFYGLLIANKMGSMVVHTIFGILAVIAIMQLWEFTGGQSVRFYFFALPAVITFTMVIMFGEQRRTIPVLLICLGIVCLLSFLFNLGSLTFTLILSVLYSSLLVFWKRRSAAAFFRSPWMFVVFGGFVVLAIAYGNGMDAMKSSMAYDENSKFDVADSEAWKNRLMFKAFGDRVPVWTGAWIQIIKEHNLWPPEKVQSFDIKTARGEKIEIDFGAHNLYLELVRHYGLMFGILVGISFIVIIICGAKLLFFQNQPMLLKVIAASVFSVGLIGSMFGQFPLMLTFSFLLMALCGICYNRFLLLNFLMRESTLVV